MKPVNRLVCLAVASVLSSTAYAQDLQLEEIVITATKREQTLQEAPISVAVTSAETIEQAQINDIADLQSIVPSLRVTTLQNSSQSNFIIRGFGNGGTNIGIEPSVGVFIDGVYRSRSVAAIGDLFDLERVEVLRGPQSTLFGLNASAGVISVVTAKPSYEWGGAVEATIGNYDYQGLRAKVTGPLSDTLAFSLAGNLFTRDGYFDLINLGTEINDRDRWDLRGQLLWEPSENLSFRLIADKGEIDELCCAVTNILAGPTAGLISLLGGQLDPNAPNSYNGYLDFAPRNQVDNSGVSLQVDWNLGNWSVTSITAQREVDSLFNTDIDFTSADLGTQVNDAKIDTFTQEFRLSYDAGGRFRGLVGAYFFEEDVDYDTAVSWGSDFRSYATLLVQASTGCFVGAPSCNPNAFGGLEAALGLPAGALLAGGQFNAQF
ncbi:MAG: TonB-dependent receptor, partial [Steroidobacteraceae bacterium]